MFFKNKCFVILILSLTIASKANTDEESPSIIIVGAGASGIAAASKLFQKGFKNVKILEAENRIGGRVFTTQFGGYLVDLGGQWVHGEENNVAFELAWPLGLLEKGNKIHMQYELYDSTGEKIDQSLTNDLYEFIKKATEDLADFAKENRTVSKGAYFKNKLDNYLEMHPNWKKDEKGLLKLLDMMDIAQDAADTWWNVSVSSDVEFHENSGDYLINWKKRGYGTILDILMKRYPTPEEELPVMNNTILNADVSFINYENEKVTVETTDGKKYFADHVIVTCSLGVLKAKDTSLFKPALPEEKQKTIETLGFGGVGKIYLSYEEPWWSNENVDYALLWKDQDLEMLQNDPEKSWLQGLVGFTTVEHKPRLLYGWISGVHSLEMENIPEEKLKKQCVEVLERFLGNSFNITAPTGILRTTWNTNKHFLGTYSHRSMKAERENVFPATLAEPIGETKPIILFAGEATNPHQFSTVHGAIETGWREADRIINHYKNLGQIETSSAASA